MQQGYKIELQPAYKLAVLLEWVEESPPALKDIKNISREQKRITTYWRVLTENERDECFLKRFMHGAQRDIVIMMDMLFAKMGDLAGVSKKVLSTLMACLEELLDFIARWRPQYFNMGQEVPECLRQRRVLELEAEREGAQVLPSGCTYAQLVALKKDGAAALRMGFEDDLPLEMTAEEELMMSRYLKVWGGFKMHIKISVALFGMLLGTLINVKVMEPTTRERGLIMKFFAEHIRTDMAKSVSPNSLNNHSNSKDIRLLRAMIALCERMIQSLNEIIERVLSK